MSSEARHAGEQVLVDPPFAVPDWIKSLEHLAVPIAPPSPRQGVATALSRSPLSRRAVRVMTLTAVVAFLGVLDLVFTLTYLRTVGMPEGNPIARMVMSYNSPAMLIAWKCATILASSFIFYLARRRITAELACWFCAFVLVWLTARWVNFAYEVEHVTPFVHALSECESRTWVSMIDNK